MKQIILLLLYLSLPFSIIADQAIESFVTDTSSGIAYYQTFNNNEYGIGISGSFYSLDSSTNSNITNLGLWIEKRIQIQTDVIFNYGITLGTSFGTSSGSNISDAYSIGTFFGFGKRFGQFSVESFTTVANYNTKTIGGITQYGLSMFSSGIGIKYFF